MREEIIEDLRKVSLSLAEVSKGFRRRYITNIISQSLQEKPRIKLLKGFRGVGKTTALLQIFSDQLETSFYFSADHPIVKEEGIYSIGKEAIKSGYSVFFIDEAHTYPKWKENIKALHDEFPNIKFIVSGSAPLALVPERREEVIQLHEMDLGEYLFLKTNQSPRVEEEWRDKESTLRALASNPTLENEFYKYTKFGGFPASLDVTEEKALDAIYHSIRKSIREDAVFFLNMSKEKVFGMENLLVLLATSKPGELSITSLSNSLGLSKTTIYEIVHALENMEIIRIIRPYKKGAALVRSEPKILFFHPNLRYAVCRQVGVPAEVGAVREDLGVFALRARGWFVFTIKGMKKSPDYIIEKNKEKLVIEIGGKGKGKAQLKGFENSFVVGENQIILLSLVAKSSKIG